MDLIEAALTDDGMSSPGVYSGPVVWPGQDPDAADDAWLFKPEHLYEVYAKEINRGTEAYIVSLVKCAASGDWMAHAVLAFHYAIPGAREFVDSLPALRLATTGTLCDHTLYAYGAFLYTIGRCNDALDMWTRSLDPRAAFSAAVSTGRIDVDQVIRATDSHPLIEPHRSYVVNDQAVVARMAVDNPHAAIFYTMLSPSSKQATRLLLDHAKQGCEGAARRYLAMEERPPPQLLATMAEAGVQCVYDRPLPIQQALSGKQDRLRTDARRFAAEIAKTLYGVDNVE